MIPLHLKEQSWKPYEGYGQYGYVSSARFPQYQGYHLSIIDDITESESRRMTTLIHVSPNVRVIQNLTYIKDLQYLSFSPEHKDEDFLMYPKQSLSTEDALKTLREIFCKLEPFLQVTELRGFDQSKGREYDPNEASGTYLLNDEEIYFITRKNGKVKFEKGGIIVSEYPHVKPKNKYTLAEEEIHYPIYKLSMEYAILKNQISLHSNKYLRTGELAEKVEQFNSIQKELEKHLTHM